METIEFDYDSVDGRTLNIIAEFDNNQIYFKAFEKDKRVSKGSLTNLDVKNIESFIRDNSERDLEFESDFYNRQSD